mmetsp:Transcript_5993/g.15921  ORF Transcript_5993/g.15921 Transcript_5993/m.15921 type:complete len:245 (+) Transcript_5993:65-799(+)
MSARAMVAGMAFAVAHGGAGVKRPKMRRPRGAMVAMAANRIVFESTTQTSMPIRRGRDGSAQVELWAQYLSSQPERILDACFARSPSASVRPKPARLDGAQLYEVCVGEVRAFQLRMRPLVDMTVSANSLSDGSVRVDLGSQGWRLDGITQIFGARALDTVDVSVRGNFELDPTSSALAGNVALRIALDIPPMLAMLTPRSQIERLGNRVCEQVLNSARSSLMRSLQSDFARYKASVADASARQ